MERISNNSPQTGYRILFFNGVVLINDLHQRMIVNISQQGFHKDPFTNRFSNNDQESQAPPNCMHHILLVESSHKMLRLSKFRPMTYVVGWRAQGTLGLYFLPSPYLCNFLLLHGSSLCKSPS